jgi:pyruvate dehydrogenase complex dehydrogenase (E1) component
VTLGYTRDTDPVETKEWLDSLEGVIEVDGPERAHFLLNRVMDGARQKGVQNSSDTCVRALNRMFGHKHTG